MPYWEELEYNDPDDIDGPEDVVLPVTMHHMQAKAELDLLLKAGAIDEDDAKDVMQSWKAEQEMTDERKLRAAVSELEDRGFIPEDEAEGIREEIAG